MNNTNRDSEEYTVKRYHELDSLRGLAALTVMFSHIALVFQPFNRLDYSMSDPMFWVKYTPLHLFWAGHEAVMFFFVLSGFVLALPFLNGNQITYPSYAIKRIVRIYFPFLVAMLFALTMRTVLKSNGELLGLSEWINGNWQADLHPSSIIKQFQLLISFDATVTNPVVWSLVQEMRISLIFPLIAFALIKFNWKINLSIALGLTLSYMVMGKVISFGDTYLVTMHYTGMFILGGVIAKHRKEISEIVSNKSSVVKVSMLFLGIFFYTLRFTLYPYAHGPLSELVVATGACIIIIVSLSSTKLSNILDLKPIRFTGKISYSLYLYHIVVLFAVFHTFNGRLPYFVMIIMTIAISYLIATISYYWVEKPSMMLGKRWASKKNHTSFQRKPIFLMDEVVIA